MLKGNVYTIGYGGRTFEDVIKHLQKYEIQYLIDVRTTPFSRFQPEFSKEPLLHTLENHSIRYVFMGDLLGGKPEDDNCYTDGKVDYEKCESKDFFKKGITRIKKAIAQGLNICILCSEGKPWMCHRSKLIGKVLSDDGIDIKHLLPGNKICTQKEAINQITRGQQNLFGEQFTSRKSYR